jgi:ketosteroid isomerase-like protein
MAGAREVADRYFTAINAGDLPLLSSLFVPDAVVLHPSGTYEGVEAIANFYRDTVIAFQTSLVATAIATEADLCTVEFEGRSPLGGPEMVVYACDVFRVSPDGRIISLHIYYR